jgi:hypothetical protein
MNAWARSGACHRAGHFGLDPLPPLPILRLLENLAGYLLVQPPAGVLHVSPFDVHSFKA